MPVYSLTKMEEAGQAKQLAEQEAVASTSGGSKSTTSTSAHKYVNVEGPLSQLFTEALQRVYATESYMQETLPKILEDSGVPSEEADLYVYSADGDKLTTQDVVGIINELHPALEKGKKVVLVANTVKPSKALEHLVDFCNVSHIDVSYRTDVGAAKVLMMLG